MRLRYRLEMAWLGLSTREAWLLAAAALGIVYAFSKFLGVL